MPIDTEHAAAVLYGGTPASTQAPGASAPAPEALSPGDQVQRQLTDEADQAAALYGDPSEHVDHEGRDTVHAPTQRAIESAAVERFGMEPEEARESAQAWGQVFREFSLSSAESGHLTEVALPYLEGTAEVDRIALANESRGALASEYGARAAQVLEASRKLVARHPNLARLLDQTGLGSHPAVVRAVARKADALQRAGKL